MTAADYTAIALAFLNASVDSDGDVVFTNPANDCVDTVTAAAAAELGERLVEFRTYEGVAIMEAGDSWGERKVLDQWMALAERA